MIEKSRNIRAVVINTGFTTKRGIIIRKILNQVNQEPNIYRTALVFVTESAIIGLIAFAVFCIRINAEEPPKG